jgi:hypothetical protein
MSLPCQMAPCRSQGCESCRLPTIQRQGPVRFAVGAGRRRAATVEAQRGSFVNGTRRGPVGAVDDRLASARRPFAVPPAPAGSRTRPNEPGDRDRVCGLLGCSRRGLRPGPIFRGPVLLDPGHRRHRNPRLEASGIHCGTLDRTRQGVGNRLGSPQPVNRRGSSTAPPRSASTITRTIGTGAGLGDARVACAVSYRVLRTTGLTTLGISSACELDIELIRARWPVPPLTCSPAGGRGAVTQ